MGHAGCRIGIWEINKIILTNLNSARLNTPDHVWPRIHVHVQVQLPFALCGRCDTANVVTFNFCHACGTRPHSGAPVPRQPRAQPVTINESALHERRNEVLAAIRGRKGRQRKCVVADGFDAFVRVHFGGLRGWVSAMDTDVLDWLCWLDSQGAGNTVVHTRLCPGVGTAT